MTNATVWELGTSGWASLTNQTNITIIQAAISGWQQSGNGLAAILVFSAIIYLGMFIVYVRTNNAFSASFIGILLGLVVAYYDLLNFSVDLSNGGTWYGGQAMYGVYIMIILLLGFGFAKIFLKD